ncbi:MAG: glycoside hydrolase family 13 protein [Saprospiraceae bacterium]|nr:glycoside hydrolase family 13 protein [Saprospiraceae bacterium]
MKSIISLIYLAVIILVVSCQSKQNKSTEMAKLDEAPGWAASAIWYQIFVERFRNGNPENDPTLETMKGALMDPIPASWSVTPWNHNWYEQEAWAKETGLDFYRTIQMRRYGGDLEGVLQKISYLQKLGINAVYFNPLNDSPSLHKYDARSYHHIDVNFGDDRDGDIALMKEEDPANPASWVWTSADKKFVEVIRQLHKAGIKVVLDYSWNHTGPEFWAFQDIIKKGKESPFASWYEIKSFDDPSTAANEWEYDGWLGVKTMPELKKTRATEKKFGYAFEGNMPDEVKSHIFAVCQRWMDPNNDGNPEDGIDGMRLDVAEHVPLGFWRDLRKHVRGINDEFYLVGENWWTKWPDELMDAEPWVKGDVFDAVMHYQWFKPVRCYVNQGDDKINLTEFYDQIDSIYKKYRPGTQDAMMNLVSSHDSERILSALYNTNKYKFHSKPAENPNYRTGQPDVTAKQKMNMVLLHQFTFKGAPHIWNGDEMGMWGADDPDNRKPLWWEDIDMKSETPIDPRGGQYQDKPAFDQQQFDYLISLCHLRKNHIALQKGSYAFIRELASNGIMAYNRETADEKMMVLINAEPNSKTIDVGQVNGYKPVFSTGVEMKEKDLVFSAYSGIVMKKI